MRLLLLLFSLSAFAEPPNLLADYTKSKSFRCHLSQDELANQLAHQLDGAVSTIREKLKIRGVEKIEENRGAVRFGTFPGAPIYDFDVIEPIAVGDGGHIQTTHYNDASDQPLVEAGLWIPFTILDNGADSECQLQKILAHVSSKDAKFLPLVEVANLNLPASDIKIYEPLDISVEEKPLRPNPKSKASRPHSNGATVSLHGPGYCIEGANKRYYCNPLNGQPPYERNGD